MEHKSDEVILGLNGPYLCSMAVNRAKGYVEFRLGDCEFTKLNPLELERHLSPLRQIISAYKEYSGHTVMQSSNISRVYFHSEASHAPNISDRALLNLFETLAIQEPPYLTSQELQSAVDTYGLEPTRNSDNPWVSKASTPQR